MKVDVIMPQMGESIAEGTITKWLKTPGDPIKRDEPLFEISTDKVDAEIPSPTEGILAEILIKEGETVPIQTVVAIIETERKEEQRGQGAREPRSTGAERQGDRATRRHSEDELIAASPVPRPFPAPAVSPPEAPRREVAIVSHPWEKVRQVVTIQVPQPGESPVPRAPIRSSPVVQKLAQEYGVDLSKVQGTGIKGRITKRDVLSYLENRRSAALPTLPETATRTEEEMITAKPQTRTTAASASSGRIEIVPMTVMRKKIAEHMLSSQRTSAHVSTVFEIDMTRVSTLRKQLKTEFQNRHGVNLTYLPFIIKACVEALQSFPILNASVNGDKIVYKKDISIGVAVALDWGLIVPVIRNSDEKSLVGLAKAVTDLAIRARNKQLTPDDVQGGTFTITNPGLFGSLFGTPIINQPQVAILGVGHITKRPVVIGDDAIAIRSMAYFTLTFDHRIIDGAVADQFMSHIKGTLERFDLALE